MRIRLPPRYDVAAVDFAEDRLVVTGTEGQVSVYSLDQSPSEALVTAQLQAETQDKKTRIGRAVAIMASLSNLLVVFDPPGASGFALPTLEPIPRFSMRDVTLVVSDPHKQEQEEVIVCTKAAIRILNISFDTVSLTKTIEYPGIATACVTGHLLLVATAGGYELVDLAKESKIPLFPINKNLQPLVSVVSQSEFLVVQGTGATELAMGLIITDQGEVAREGQVITWKAYPTSVCVSHETVLAIVEDQMVVYDLTDGIREVDAMNLSDMFGECNSVSPEKNEDTGKDTSESEWSGARLFRTTGTFRVVDRYLMEKLNPPSPILVESDVLVCFDNSLAWWTPPSQFAKVERGILAGNITEITPDTLTLDSESAVMQIEYLSLLLAMHLLDTDANIEAVKAWLDGVRLDPEIVLYIFDPERNNPPPIFPGLKGMLESLAAKEKTKQAGQFFKSFLRTQIKRNQGSSDQVFLGNLERMYALLISEKELVSFLSHEMVTTRAALLESLLKEGKFNVAEEVYRQGKEPAQLCDLWVNLISDGNNSSKQIESIKQKMLQYLLESSDADLVWSYGMKLVAIDPKMGVQVFTKSGRQTKLDEEMVADKLKRDDGDIAWRAYLKYLVYDLKRPSYVKDLVALVGSEIIELVATSTLREKAAQCYKTYSDLNWRKRPYYEYIDGYKNGLSDKDFDLRTLLTKQLEFVNLLCQPRSDNSSIANFVSSFDEHAQVLSMERCVLYSIMGLYSQSLNLLVHEIKDYKSALHYCRYGFPVFDGAEPHVLPPAIVKDLAAQVMKSFVSEHTRNHEHALNVLLDQYKEYLDLTLVLSTVPVEWPAKVLAGCLPYHLKRSNTKRADKGLLRALAKRETANIQQAIYFLRQGVDASPSVPTAKKS